MPISHAAHVSSSADDVRGIATLCPELNLAELERDGLLPLFQHRTSYSPEQLREADLHHVRQRIHHLAGRQHGEPFTVYPADDAINEGEPFAFAEGRGPTPEMQHFIEQGLFVVKWEWEPMQNRQEMILDTLSLIADEYLTEHLKTTTVVAHWVPTCELDYHSSGPPSLSMC